MRRFASLRSKRDFARLRARGRRTVTANLAIFRGEAAPDDTRTLVGFSVSKSVGGAVRRNKVRRRLSACIQEVLTDGLRERILVIARPSAAEVSYTQLRSQIERALR